MCILRDIRSRITRYGEGYPWSPHTEMLIRHTHSVTCWPLPWGQIHTFSLMVCTVCLPCHHHENPYRLMPCSFPLDQCLIDTISPLAMDHQADSIFLYHKHNFDGYPRSVVVLHSCAMHTCFCHYFLYSCVAGRLGDLCAHGETWTGQHPPRQAPCSLFCKHRPRGPAHLSLILVLPLGSALIRLQDAHWGL